MAFTRGTTPTYTFTFNGLSLYTVNDVYITFEQTGGTELTKHSPDVVIEPMGNKAILTLTQTETLSFSKGSVKVQLRAIDENGTAVATAIFTDKVNEVLYEGVI